MIDQNLALVRDRIKKAAKRAARNSDDITLLCVTKTIGSTKLREALASGVTDIGENRVDDAISKYNRLGSQARDLKWHMIGHLQTNKVKNTLDIFDTIDSLDSIKLAKEIEKRASLIGRKVDCLVEVNTSKESSKYGIEEEEVERFITEVSTFSHIHVIGLMTMAPIVNKQELARPYFSKLRQIKDNLKAKNIPNTDIRELSMGMSQDFEVAIEEGATIVRIGTAIFE